MSDRVVSIFVEGSKQLLQTLLNTMHLNREDSNGNYYEVTSEAREVKLLVNLHLVVSRLEQRYNMTSLPRFFA